MPKTFKCVFRKAVSCIFSVYSVLFMLPTEDKTGIIHLTFSINDLSQMPGQFQLITSMEKGIIFKQQYLKKNAYFYRQSLIKNHMEKQCKPE